MLNKWRVVTYTDDGCSIYECLKCRGSWESRCAPGWNEEWEEVDGPGEGVTCCLTGKEQVPHYSRKRETPIYHTVWRFCPRCGTEWDGSARVSEDDFGPRRTRRREAMRNWKQRDPDFCWVVEEWFVPWIWIDDEFKEPEGKENWEPQHWYRGLVVPVNRVLEHTREYAKLRQADYDDATVHVRIRKIRDLEEEYGRHVRIYESY